MATTPSSENRYVLFTDGTVVDLLENFAALDDIDATIAQLTENHGAIVKAENSPLKIFSEVTGFKKTDEFVRIGPKNWPNLFLIHGEFDYFLGFVIVDGKKILAASSSNGVLWRFNVIDA